MTECLFTIQRDPSPINHRPVPEPGFSSVGSGGSQVLGEWGQTFKTTVLLVGEGDTDETYLIQRVV